MVVSLQAPSMVTGSTIKMAVRSISAKKRMAKSFVCMRRENSLATWTVNGHDLKFVLAIVIALFLLAFLLSLIFTLRLHIQRSNECLNLQDHELTQHRIWLLFRSRPSSTR